MKALLLSASAIAILSGAASAADIPTYEAAPMVEAPVVVSPMWTGAYIGGQLGYAFNHSNDDSCFDGTAGTDLAGGGGGGGIGLGIAPGDAFDCEGAADGAPEFDFGSDDDDDDDGSFFAGAHIGYDHQIGNFVLGAVADVNWLFDGDHDDDDGGGIDLDDLDTLIGDGGAEIDEFATVYVDDGVESLDWYGTARLRAGFAAGSFLIYGTGGLAFGDSGGSSREVEISGIGGAGQGGFTVDGGAPVDPGTDERCETGGGEFTCVFGGDDDDDDINVGWALGAGVDFLATRNFKIGLEYLYVNLGGDDDGEDTEIVFADDTTLEFEGSEIENDFHTIGVRAAFKFGG